jgi:hypoxanthine phosphoribosyltransferase
MKKRYLTWNCVEELTDKLVDEIKLSPVPPLYITGLPRGGLIPAVMLSHKLDIPFKSIDSINSIPRVDVLIVDDIADSGETLNQYGGYQTAVLHYKMQSEHIPTYYAEEVDNEEWIVYPFEREDSEPIQDYKVK